MSRESHGVTSGPRHENTRFAISETAIYIHENYFDLPWHVQARLEKPSDLRSVLSFAQCRR